MRKLFAAALTASLTFLAQPGCAANVAVPDRCEPSVNQRLGTLIDGGERNQIDNVMVCGTTIGPSRPQRAGAHGTHQLLPLRVRFSDGSTALVEVVTNDALDGRVTAAKGAQVFAYGQYFATSARQAPFNAGIHDTHCATHRGADNGWVVVDGRRFPRRACRA
jgi:hypothetical protein